MKLTKRLKSTLSIINSIFLTIFVIAYLFNFNETISCSYALDSCKLTNSTVFGNVLNTNYFNLTDSRVKAVKTTDFIDKLLIKHTKYYLYAERKQTELRMSTFLALDDYKKQIELTQKYGINNIEDMKHNSSLGKDILAAFVFFGLVYILIIFNKTADR